MSTDDQHQTAGRSGLTGVFRLIASIAVLLLALLALGFAVGVVSRESLGDIAGKLLVVLGILGAAALLIGRLIGRDKG